MTAQRYYSSQLGRFLTPDPGGFRTANPADPQSWNRYAYVQGDPVNYCDPGGLFRHKADPGPLSPSAGNGQAVSGGGHGSMFYLAVDLSRNEEDEGMASMSSASDPALAQKNDARADLGKEKCYKLLGFNSAADAQKWFDSIKFNELNQGKLQIQGGAPVAGGPNAANTLGFGTINLNMDYNWADLSKVATSAGGIYDFLGYINRMYGRQMNSEQLGTLIIIHELRHQQTSPKPSDSETIRANQTIYDNCIK